MDLCILQTLVAHVGVRKTHKQRTNAAKYPIKPSIIQPEDKHNNAHAALFSLLIKLFKKKQKTAGKSINSIYINEDCLKRNTHKVFGFMITN